ncbi:FimV domain-containing protein [Acinetobacter sp. WCHA45]|uniref:FimV domain-containing protein n=1 Tax=Acinetobacter sp. WCHA45 TaxID=2004644 RepID=UPI000B3D2EFB|nr:FimV domain-containing protein [Acinetobacter sp. WCHA45]AVZ86542.1 FimV domain-containing protein [Acinetobacter sp. WCHA45]
MSTIIIVLLIVALVVAIVLKKRSDNQTTATSKKGATAKSAKKAATTKTSRTTLAREEQESVPAAATAIPESLRQKIEQQIQNGNYQSAEAQINQILKQDNSQHELYLFLLDIHLAQKDDFAIDQLIKHIHALKLDDIAQAAEAKQREYEKNKQPDASEFNSGSSHFKQTSTSDSLAKEQNNTDFDALAASKTSQSFDDLQSGYVAPAEETKPVPEVQPLDFNFSFEKKETTEATPTIEQQENKEPAPLEFSFNLDAAPATSPVVEEAKPELDFNFSNLEVTEQKTEAAPTLDFSFEPTENKQVEVTESVVELEPVQTSLQTTSVAINDPLVQSFPDLQQLDEAQLNLELAEQYIELGAYDSARELLKNSPSFNAEQQQHSQSLLNKIAS